MAQAPEISATALLPATSVLPAAPVLPVASILHRTDRPQPWVTGYVHRLRLTDAVAVAFAVIAAQVLRFGIEAGTLLTPVSVISYSLVSGALIVAWLLTLGLFRTRERAIVGSGAEEYRRIVHACLLLFGTVAIAGFLLQIELARGYLAVALPLGLVSVLVGRRWWRGWLVSQRAAGQCLTTVLVVGSHRSAMAMAATFERDPSAGYRVVGVCVPGRREGAIMDVAGHAVPVLGDEHAVLEAIASVGANTLAISNTESLGADGIRALAWQLESSDVNLVVSSGVIDVAGPRLLIRPVAGLPLLHVDKPQYRGASKAGKLAVDLVGASGALLLAAPVMIVTALMIKLTSRGPVFYRAERIGMNGEPFDMIKFRSMIVDADRRRAELTERDEGSGPLFKVREDPRVTRVGKIIRRFSIDELPQLFNVLCGQMSIVGPRPPLAAEVTTYTGDVHRRLLVKPGITGLWQVSGRSDLSWEESVRLDLYYVENWSTIQDLIIAWRTIRAVVSPTGAY
jgi:exopolysaccharide biosynthesis polyprenyl glycosylphosphotransferase